MSITKTHILFFILFMVSSLVSSQPNKQNLTHLHFYFHDIVGGSNPTAIRVAEAPTTNSFPSLFGALIVMDNPLTMEPEMNSTLVGRGQGMYPFASQSEWAVTLMVNFAFTHGKYNGSTITVMGRNVLLAEVREMPIIGGTGVFRSARGYVEARTYSLDLPTGDAVVEHNVYVLH